MSAMQDESGTGFEGARRRTPSGQPDGSAGLALFVPADVARARPGAEEVEMPRAALTRLKNAGSTSLAAASPSLHDMTMRYNQAWVTHKAPITPYFDLA